jgi:outer membrane protein OmpA-like peptidoglycan-associated protein
MKRAQACFDYLVKKGIKVARLQVKASGESAPVAPNILDGKDNPEGRKLNRRAEFTIQR